MDALRDLGFHDRGRQGLISGKDSSLFDSLYISRQYRIIVVIYLVLRICFSQFSQMMSLSLLTIVLLKWLIDIFVI